MLTDRWCYKTDREKRKRGVHTVNRWRTRGRDRTIGYRVIGCHGRDSCIHFNILIAILRHFSRPSKRPVVQCHGVTCRISAADPNKRQRKRCRGRSNGCGGGQRFVGCVLRLCTCANIDILAGLICESTISLVGYSCRSYMDK